MAMHPPHPSNAKSAHFPMTQCCFKLYAVCLVWMRRAFAVYTRVVYLFIYFILLPVCKLARVPPVAWQRAWQWALLTLRPRPRTARALKIDPGRLTLIENKKNARAERRSRGSTGKMSMLDGGNDEIWDYYSASSDEIPAERICRWAQNVLFMADLMRAVASQYRAAVGTNNPE